ncbi:MAG: hypothetical protein ACOH5I_09300 [Oligoflexus sp.]
MHFVMQIFLYFASLLIFFAMTSCDQSPYGEPAYDLAQGCFSIHSLNDGHIITAEAHGDYHLAGEDISNQQHQAFYLKPTGLGRFLLFDRDGGLLSASSQELKRQWQADESSEWFIKKISINRDDGEQLSAYTLQNTKNYKYLEISSDLILLSNPKDDLQLNRFAFELRAQNPSSCQSYPEAELNAELLAEFTESADDQQAVVGYADLHTHIGFPKALGAVAMAGHAFHPYGIQHALADCSALHGENGELDLLESQNTSGGTSGHATAGFPEFNYWPNRETNTHVQSYYRWMERAYLSGLRLMVTNVTGNPTFCQLLGILHPRKIEGDCKSDDDIKMQVDYIYQLQDYIDAQEGGPNQGWFRIVTSPQEARQVIHANKLAVVLGSEYGTLFDCREGAKQCSEDYIDSKLEELHQMGVRSVFPIHRFDNAFGGTRPQGGTGGAWMHLTSKISTSRIEHLLDLINPAKLMFKAIHGHYWRLEECPVGVNGTGHVKSMAAFVEEDLSFLSNTVKKVPVVGNIAAKILDWAFVEKLKPLPTYEEFNEGKRVCNSRHLQPIGKYFIQKIIDKGMILEVDHMSLPTLMQTLELLEDKQYSGVVSSHGWIEDVKEIRERIFRLGGIMAPFNSSPSHIARKLETYATEIESFGYLPGVAISTDIQGVTSQAMADAGVEMNYPFSSIDSKVRFFPPATGNRKFDYTKEGIAHYGLLAEWVENLRQVDENSGTRAVEILMNSAEAFIQMWERAEMSSNGE